MQVFAIGQAKRMQKKLSEESILYDTKANPLCMCLSGCALQSGLPARENTPGPTCDACL